MKCLRWNFLPRWIRFGNDMLAAVFFLLLFGFNVQPVYSQDKYQVDLSAIEKEVENAASKPYSVGGFFEFQPIFFGIDRDHAFLN